MHSLLLKMSVVVVWRVQSRKWLNPFFVIDWIFSSLVINLVTTRNHIGWGEKLDLDLKDEWFVTMNISASSGRPVGIGADENLQAVQLQESCSASKALNISLCAQIFEYSAFHANSLF
jgi:hypothetical protein